MLNCTISQNVPSQQFLEKNAVLSDHGTFHTTFLSISFQIVYVSSGKTRISLGAPTYFWQIFADDCMRMKKNCTKKGAHSKHPFPWIRHWLGIIGKIL